MKTALNIEAAQRKVDAIDKRIDLVRAEMYGIAGINPDAFDYGTDEGQTVARKAFHGVLRDCPGYGGMVDALFLRRSYAADIRDNLIAKQARADELRAAGEYRKQYEASRHACPTCGYEHLAA